MSKRTLLSVLVFVLWQMNFISCSKESSTGPELRIAQTNIFVLCEGNFGSANSTLWMFNQDFSQIQGPIYWNPNANPLGDAGQSMSIYDDKLYIIANNSHTLEVLDLSDGINFDTTITVPNASPREMEIVDGFGYITCWYLNGLIVIDLSSNSIVDTIYVDGMPEDIVYYNGKLYTSINMNSNWVYDTRVIEIDLSSEKLIITETYEVVPGPGQMLILNDALYVASVYYDASWNMGAGTSRIDLMTGEVNSKDYGITGDYGTDLVVHEEKVYRTFGGGIAPLTESLSVNSSETIGNLTGVYSAASYGEYIYFGITTDYIAPDTVVVLDFSGQQVAIFKVGAIPGSFSFYLSP